MKNAAYKCKRYNISTHKWISNMMTFTFEFCETNERLDANFPEKERNGFHQTLNITVINRLLCEEYTSCIDNKSQIFDGHKIIDDPKILYNVLCDGCSKKNKSTTLKYKTHTSENNGFDITIEVDAIYIKDEMKIKLQYVDKHVTPKQVIERMDVKFDEIMEHITYKLNDVAERMEVQIRNEESDRKNSEGKCKLSTKKKFDEMTEAIFRVADEYSKLRDEFRNYILMMPIFHEHVASNETISKIVNANITEFHLRFEIQHVANNTTYNIDDFDTNKFKYLTQLANITFENCCRIRNLDVLAVNDNLRSIRSERFHYKSGQFI